MKGYNHLYDKFLGGIFMEITYLGHATFLVQDKDFHAIIDPFLTGNPHTDVSPEDLKDITHIFITHGHNDHMGDAETIARKWDPYIVCNAEIASYLSSKGLKTHAMHIGGRQSFRFGTVKMTPALHGSGINTENGMIEGGNPGGFLIKIGGKKLYHAGDTGLSMEMQLLARENIDVALLPIGGNFTMDVQDALTAVEFIQPKTVIPMHYKTFPVLFGEPEEFKDQVQNAEVKILNAGETFEI